VDVGPAVPGVDSVIANPDLNPAGDRFVTMNRAGTASEAVGSTGREVRYFVVTNWFAELKEEFFAPTGYVVPRRRLRMHTQRRV
jgi:hypothetical protein